MLLHSELGIVPALIMLGLAVLLGFSIRHRFFLENTVQRWYRIAEEMRGTQKKGRDSDSDKGLANPELIR